ncbi:MAG: hypothetical protein ACK5NN_00395 [Sphingomonadaceae bacterium]
MKPVALAIIIPLIFSDQIASAREDGAGSLWQTLQAGDSPQAVAGKLAAMEEIKTATVKGKPDRPKVAVRYKNGGIDILGTKFLLVPEFEHGQLARITLGTDRLCADKVDVLYDRFWNALQAKYPMPLAGPLTASALHQAKRSATEHDPAITFSGLTDGSTAIIFTQKFTAKDIPPDPPFGATSKMLMAHRLLWNMYNTTAAECGGDGARRVQLAIAYITKAEYEARMAKAKTDSLAENAEASNGYP